MAYNTNRNAEENEKPRSDTFRDLLKMAVLLAIMFGFYKVVTYAADPAPSYQEKRQQAIIKQNNQWRADVCSELGCK